MVLYTEYLGLNLPEPHEEVDRDRWGEYLNENFEFLDTNVVDRGALADRGAAGEEGRLYLVTDSEPELFFDTGTEWIAVTTPPTENIDLESWGIIDVSKHGFTGDPTTAYEEGDIMAFIRQNPNKTFYLPEGTYSVQSELDLQNDPAWDRLAIIGKPHATLRIDDEYVSAAFRIGNSNGNFEKLSLKNLTVDLNGNDAGIGRLHANKLMDNENITLKGKRNHYALGVDGNDTRGDKFVYFACMTERDGIGFHRNINAPDGDAWSGDNDNSHSIGFASDPPHVGTNIWEGCYLERFWDNGYYIKNADGANILLGCVARNCGRANIRLGYADVAIGCMSFWDMADTHEDYPIADTGGVNGFGTLLSVDEARGTAVMGFTGIRETGGNDCVLLFAAPESVTFRDMYLVNKTDQYTIRANANDSHGDSDTDSISNETTVKFDNLIIREDSTANVRGAAIRSNRPHIVFEDVDYENVGSTASRAFIEAWPGKSFTVRGGNIRSASDWAVRVDNNVDKIEFYGTTLNGGIAIATGYTVNELRMIGCDLRNVPAMFPRDENETAVGEFDFIANTGWRTTEYGELYQNSLHAKNVDSDVVTLNSGGTSGGLQVDNGDHIYSYNSNMATIYGRGSTQGFRFRSTAPTGSFTDEFVVDTTGSETTASVGGNEIWHAGNLVVSSTAPSNPSDGDIWVERQ